MAENILSQLSDDLAALVKAVSPSLVRVEARRRLPATGIVWSNDGLIVTANHVVEKSKDITIGLDDGSTVSADLVGRDETTDLALLRANAQLTTPIWGTPEDINVGNLVLAVGRPAEKVMATLGVVMTVEGEWRTHAGGQFDQYVQTDVVMYPGFSGGALVGADNKILGMNTSGIGHGVSLSITASTISRVLESLAQHGRIRRGFLGVGIQPVNLPASIAEELGQETGVLVISVENDSPAAHAGIVLGDTLVHLDNQPVRGVDELMSLLMGEAVGKEVSVKILRAGTVQDLRVTIGERAEPAEEEHAHHGRRGRFRQQMGHRPRWGR